MLIKKTLGVLTVLSGVVLGACGDDDGDGGADPGASCAQFCEKVAPLGCAGTPAASCVADCKAEAATIPAACRSVAATAASCVASRPPSDFECDFDDTATNKDGVCESEVTAALVCVLQNL